MTQKNLVWCLSIPSRNSIEQYFLWVRLFNHLLELFAVRSAWLIMFQALPRFWNFRFKTKLWNFFEVRWRHTHLGKFLRWIILIWKEAHWAPFLCFFCFFFCCFFRIFSFKSSLTMSSDSVCLRRWIESSHCPLRFSFWSLSLNEWWTSWDFQPCPSFLWPRSKTVPVVISPELTFSLVCWITSAACLGTSLAGFV